MTFIKSKKEIKRNWNEYLKFIKPSMFTLYLLVSFFIATSMIFSPSTGIEILVWVIAIWFIIFSIGWMATHE